MSEREAAAPPAAFEASTDFSCSAFISSIDFLAASMIRCKASRFEISEVSELSTSSVEDCGLKIRL